MASSGLALGAVSLVSAFKRLASSPSLWPYAALPCLVLLALMGSVLIFGATPLVEQGLALSGLPAVDTWYGRAGNFAVSGLLWLTSVLVAVWVAMVLTPPLCAPALEHLVRSEEQVLGVPARPPLSIWIEWRCGIQAQVVGLMCSTCIWLVLTALSVALPPLVVVTLPLKVIAVSAALAWSLLDYPLTLRGVPATRRLKMFASQPLAIVGFGLPFSLLFWFPCTSVLLLPVGAVAATRVVWSLAKENSVWKLELDGASSSPTSPPGS